MAVAYKAPIKDIVFGYEVVDTYDVIGKIPAFSDFTEDIVIPTMEECAKFAEEVLAPINAIGDQQGATIDNGKVSMPPEFVDAYKRFAEAGWASRATRVASTTGTTRPSRLRRCSPHAPPLADRARSAERGDSDQCTVVQLALQCHSTVTVP